MSCNADLQKAFGGDVDDPYQGLPKPLEINRRMCQTVGKLLLTCPNLHSVETFYAQVASCVRFMRECRDDSHFSLPLIIKYHVGVKELKVCAAIIADFLMGQPLGQIGGRNAP
jgi:hypothetical protein